MNPVLQKLQASLIQQPLFLNQAVSLCRATLLMDHPIWGGTAAITTRQYKSMPTHGIGKWKHLLPKDSDKAKKKKEKHKMKQRVEATNTAYGTLNVQVSGYDMTVVEHYSQYIHNVCNRFGIKVSESYALPTKSTEVMLMPEQGTKMYIDAVLKTHKRVVQLSSLNASMSPILMDILLKNQPEGVELSVQEHTDADFHARFKARPELEGLMAQMNQKDM